MGTRLIIELRLDEAVATDFATVGRWLVGQGERIEPGQPLVEVEADKVNHEIASPVAGVVEEILAEEGDEVPVGSVLARLEAQDAA